ncbi:MAG TPA: extracellular solute-binding protein [Candidatus Binatia bacterium]|nr:extracellular solute-binding protein [Candidatus Binatia bacterium]
MATSAKTEEVVFPAFEKRFPGIKVNHVNATADQLVTRAVAEARGGRIIADVISGTQNYITQLREQDMLLDIALPEGASYPAVLKGSYWVATDTEFFIAAWNSSRLKKEDEPKTFEDFADPKWAKRLIAEPRDFQLFAGFSEIQIRQRRKGYRLIQKDCRQ